MLITQLDIKKAPTGLSFLFWWARRDSVPHWRSVLASGVASQIKMQAFLLGSAPTKREPYGFIVPLMQNKKYGRWPSFLFWWARRDLNPHGIAANRF